MIEYKIDILLHRIEAVYLILGQCIAWINFLQRNKHLALHSIRSGQFSGLSTGAAPNRNSKEWEVGFIYVRNKAYFHAVISLFDLGLHKFRPLFIVVERSELGFNRDKLRIQRLFSLLDIRRRISLGSWLCRRLCICLLLTASGKALYKDQCANRSK